MDFKKLKEKKITIVDKDSGFKRNFVYKTFQLPNGLVEDFFVEAPKDSVQILAFTKNKEVILVEQYRPSIEKTTLELPGGGLEPGEDPKKAAIRELREETSYTTNNIEFLHVDNYNIYSLGKRYTFVALDCESVGSQDLDPNEFIEIKKLPFENFKEAISQGKIRGWDIAYMALDKYNLL